MGTIRKPYKSMRQTLLRVGLLAPDTKFNRRAATYAKTAAKHAAVRAAQAKHKARYVPRRKKDRETA